jgi:tRNA dimethylallyltransferase
MAGRQNENFKLKIDKLLMIGLQTKDYKDLYKRIDNRVEARIKQGAEKEVKWLISQGNNWDLPAFSATGYRVWKDYFQEKMTLPELIERWKYDEHSLVRRQLTFFKKDKRIKWFDIEKKSYFEKIEKKVSQWYI